MKPFLQYSFLCLSNTVAVNILRTFILLKERLYSYEIEKEKNNIMFVSVNS